MRQAGNIFAKNNRFYNIVLMGRNQMAEYIWHKSQVLWQQMNLNKPFNPLHPSIHQWRIWGKNHRLLDDASIIIKNWQWFMQFLTEALRKFSWDAIFNTQNCLSFENQSSLKKKKKTFNMLFKHYASPSESAPRAPRKTLKLNSSPVGKKRSFAMSTFSGRQNGFFFN